MKILTDIDIIQSQLWGKKTSQFRGVGRSDSFLKHLPPTIAGFFAALLNALLILIKYREYDVVINADIKTAQFLGFFRSVFKLVKPKHIILELMLDEENTSVGWSIKKRFQKICFSSVDVIFVSASREVRSYTARFNLKNGQVRFLPFHTNIIEPKIVEGKDTYILSAGRTGRDFVTLSAAVDGLDVKVVVVGDQNSLKGIKFPANVQVFKDISYGKYLELLYDCFFTVIPLSPLVKSTGQVAFLESMALGKPVIVTETTGSLDYFTDGVDGVMVPPEDPDELRKAIVLLMQSQQMRASLAQHALDKVKSHHTFDAYTQSILQTAVELTK